jgi:hypothetical protein
MKDLNAASLFEARLLALVEREKVAHALLCRSCGLREEALFDLAVLGWDEVSFYEDAWSWGDQSA